MRTKEIEEELVPMKTKRVHKPDNWDPENPISFENWMFKIRSLTYYNRI